MDERPQPGQLRDFSQYSGGGGNGAEPPVLAQYLNTPAYELATIAGLVGVRPLTLWAWEQHIGISSDARSGQDLSGHKRRYSERDLVALLWMRDRVVEGETPQDAAARLLAAQRMRSGSLNSGPLNSGPLNSGPLNSGPLNSTGGRGGPRGVGTQSGSLGSGALHSGALTSGGWETGQMSASQAPRYASGGSGSLAQGSGALGGLGGYYASSMERGGQEGQLGQGWGAAEPRNPYPSRPVTMDAYAQPGAQASQRASASGRLGANYGAAMARPGESYDYTEAARTAREIRPLVAPLLQAFARFDTNGAHRVIRQALDYYPMEVVCLGLVQPAITRVSDLWSKSELTVPEERFALNYLRSFLSYVFHATHETEGAPFVVIGCAQRDMSDLPALILATLCRRAGLRVAYLGADVDLDELARQRWPLIPGAIALSMSSSQRIRGVNRLAKYLDTLQAPSPTLCYMGPPFAHNPDLQRKVHALYLGDNTGAATGTLRSLLGMEY